MERHQALLLKLWLKVGHVFHAGLFPIHGMPVLIGAPLGFASRLRDTRAVSLLNQKRRDYYVNARWKWASMLIAVAGIGACTPKQEAVPVASAPAIEHIATAKQVMLGLTIPASDVLFQIGGSAPPSDQAAWDRIVANAAMLAESGNLLLSGPRDLKQSEWMQFSSELVVKSRDAMAAAAKKDVDAVLEAGNGIYEVCSKCHDKYMPAKVAEQAAVKP